MAQERVETRMILREGEVTAVYGGPLEPRAPVDHLRKLLEERISLGRRLAVLLLTKDFQWNDALQRLKTWNAFNTSELARFVASPEAVAAYKSAISAPNAATAPAERSAVFQAAVQAPLGLLLGFYARLEDA